MTHQPPAKPQRISIPNWLTTIVFLIIWLAIQLGLHRVVNGLNLAGVEYIGLRIFQIIAGLVTLVPIVAYYIVDLRMKRLANAIIEKGIGIAPHKPSFKAYGQRLVVFGLLVFTSAICLGGYLLLRQYSSVILLIIFLGLLLMLTSLTLVSLFYLNQGRFDKRLVNLRNIDLKERDLSASSLQANGLAALDLPDTDLKHAQLAGANLNGAILVGADLERANLQWVSLGRGQAE